MCRAVSVRPFIGQSPFNHNTNVLLISGPLFFLNRTRIVLFYLVHILSITVYVYEDNHSVIYDR